MISSTSNAQVKEIEKLKTKARYRRETGCFLVEGRKMVEEAGARIKKIYLSESCFERKEESELAKQHDYEVVTDKVFAQLSDTISPQGIMAVVKMPQYSMESFLKVKTPFFLLLEDLQDPGNLGTIMRTAEGAGADAVILSKNSVDLFNPKVVRATMGSIFRQPFVYVENFHDTLKMLQNEGVSLYTTHLKGTGSYSTENYCGACGILIGNEANGIKDETAALADHLVKIPMEGKLESLNASVAAAIMMYEVHRQRSGNSMEERK